MTTSLHWLAMPYYQGEWCPIQVFFYPGYNAGVEMSASSERHLLFLSIFLLTIRKFDILSSRPLSTSKVSRRFCNVSVNRNRWILLISFEESLTELQLLLLVSLWQVRDRPTIKPYGLETLALWVRLRVLPCIWGWCGRVADTWSFSASIQRGGKTLIMIAPTILPRGEEGNGLLGLRVDSGSNDWR